MAKLKTLVILKNTCIVFSAVDDIKEHIEDMVLQMSEREKQTGSHLVVNVPYLILVIDELKDDLLDQDLSILGSLSRLVQRARAGDIHLILVTQYPTANMVGDLKTDTPTKVSFTMTSGVQSRVILDEVGAEKLKGLGDHLVKWNGKSLVLYHGYDLSDICMIFWYQQGK